MSTTLLFGLLKVCYRGCDQGSRKLTFKPINKQSESFHPSYSYSASLLNSSPFPAPGSPCNI
eukprot:1155411-Pelagomonas_calceolata.AAC.1